MSAQYTIGLDYGTNSVRALIVNVANGREVATAVWGYEHGEAGVILSRDPNLARQHPADYVKGAEVALKKAVAAALGRWTQSVRVCARCWAAKWWRWTARPYAAHSTKAKTRA